MFEPTILPSKYKRSWNWTWPQVFIIVLLLLGVIHFYRVNAVSLVPVAATPTPFISTTGIVVEGPVTIEAQSFLTFKMDFNSRVTFKGWFAASVKNSRIDCLLLNKEAFEIWKNGGEYKAVAQTGFLPGGRIERVLEPDTYYLIFDNRLAGEPVKKIDTYFKVD
ncbi:MAG: hypothetical protein WKF92_13905 [Pyrinomonadaceae bacterium]